MTLPNDNISKIRAWKENAFLAARNSDSEGTSDFHEYLGMYAAFSKVLKLLDALYCPACNKPYNDEDNQTSINKLGMCLACDSQAIEGNQYISREDMVDHMTVEEFNTWELERNHDFFWTN